MEIFIPLSPSQWMPVRRWVANFCRHERYWVHYPSVKGAYLQIHPLSFPFLLAYVDPTESNEFDILRLKHIGKQVLKAGLDESSCEEERRTYLHALFNLEYISIGEFLEKPTVREIEALPPAQA